LINKGDGDDEDEDEEEEDEEEELEPNSGWQTRDNKKESKSELEGQEFEGGDEEEKRFIPG
jgi:hypothetical protein